MEIPPNERKSMILTFESLNGLAVRILQDVAVAPITRLETLPILLGGGTILRQLSCG